jgi:hypothetical protein
MLSHVRWWAWVSIGIGIAAIATVASYLIVVARVPPLTQEGSYAWYFQQDASRSVGRNGPDNNTWWIVPERPYQRQGFTVGVYNDTGWTQTVLGLDPAFEIGSMQPMTVAVARGLDPTAGKVLGQTRWAMPATIPPHSWVLLRLLWTSHVCLPPGTSTGLSEVPLRVRVGLVTRTEHIPLELTWAISGSKATNCSGNESEPRR